MFVGVVSSGAWPGFKVGSLYIAGSRGDVSPPELSGNVENGNEKLQDEGAKA